MYVVLDRAMDDADPSVYGPFEDYSQAHLFRNWLVEQHQREEEAGGSFIDPENVWTVPVIEPTGIVREEIENG
jgi:hypothetical protein